MQNSLWAWSAAVLTCIRGVLSGQLRRCCTATGLWPTTTHPEWRQTTRERKRSISVKRLAAVDVKQWRLTANPKAEALWRMTETAGKKSRVQLTRHLSTFFLELLSHLYHYFKRTTSNRGTLELYQHAFCVFFFFFKGYSVHVCSKREATPSPASAACHHGSVAGKGRKEQDDETKMRKMQMEGRNPLVSTQGLFLARLTGDQQLASALNAEALWSLSPL